MHNLEAIVELAKAGMTYEQITDLLNHTNQEEPEPEPKPEPDEPASKGNEPNPEPKEPEPEPEPDYKKMYEESQKALQAAQKANRAKEETQNKPKSAEDQLVDIFADAFF